MTNFIVVTPAYNCEKSIERTLYSIAGQTYKNWKMYVIDDMSTDNTFDVVTKFVTSHDLLDKIEIIQRKEKFGETRNTLDIIKRLNPQDVVVRVDASDFITDLGCFDYLNMIYQKYDPAVLWTKHRWSFSENNISGPIDLNTSIYKQPWATSHMKTFRVNDFLGLNHDNFKDSDGNWIMIACDQAVFLPMLERARINKRPLVYFDKVMYHYDIDLQDPDLFVKDRSIIQKQSAEMLRERGFIN